MTIQADHEMFDMALRAAGFEASNGESDVLAIWALGFLRGVQDRDLRHAALDGIMAALDDRDAG